VASHGKGTERAESGSLLFNRDSVTVRSRERLAQKGLIVTRARKKEGKEEYAILRATTGGHYPDWENFWGCRRKKSLLTQEEDSYREMTKGLLLMPWPTGGKTDGGRTGGKKKGNGGYLRPSSKAPGGNEKRRRSL